MLDLVCAVCDTCFQDGRVFLLGDFNADLGDSTGSRGTYRVTARGKLLLEFIHNFNMCPVNFTSLAKGSFFTFHQSVIDHILVPNLFINRIISSFTHEWTIDNLSDLVPVTMAFECEVALPAHVDLVQEFSLDVRHISWDKLNELDIHEHFTKPSTELLNASDFSSLNASEFVHLLIGLFWRTCKDNLTVKHTSKKSDMGRKKKASMLIHIIFGRKVTILLDPLKLTLGKKSFRTFVKNKLLEEQRRKEALFVMQHRTMKDSSGNS